MDALSIIVCIGMALIGIILPILAMVFYGDDDEKVIRFLCYTGVPLGIVSVAILYIPTVKIATEWAKGTLLVDPRNPGLGYCIVWAGCLLFEIAVVIAFFLLGMNLAVCIAGLWRAIRGKGD